MKIFRIFPLVLIICLVLAFAALFCYLYLVFNYESIARVPRLTQFQYIVGGVGIVLLLEACRRALAAGKLECDELPHRETVRMMKVMDLIRRGMGVTYPFE